MLPISNPKGFSMSKSKLKKIEIVENKLGRQQALGLWQKTGKSTTITLDPRLKGFQRLMILIHESLHELAPEWTEDKVMHVSEILAGIVWKCDYRHVDHAGEDTPDYTMKKPATKKKKVVKIYEQEK